MSRRSAPPRYRQQGVAAIEFSLILPVMMLMLAFTLMFSRVFWHYNVALKAAHDAATMLAQARKAEIAVIKPDLSELEIAKFARTIAVAELAELRPGNGAIPQVTINCDNQPCIGDKPPQLIYVGIRMRMVNFSLPFYTSEKVDSDGLWLYAEMKVPYVGR